MQKTTNQRLIAVRWMTLAAFAFAVVSQARVHLFGRNNIIESARKSNRFIVTTTDTARRGPIYSSDGRPLAQEDDSRILVVDFRKVPRIAGFYMALGAATGIPASEFASLSQGKKKVVEWQKAFSTSQAEGIQSVKRKWQADGIGLKPAGSRSYGLSLAASTIVGTVRSTGPSLGVEQALNRNLVGENGESVGMVDRYGQYLPMKMGSQTKAKRDGRPITLTIDSELQRVAYEAVTQAVKARNADQGTVVIMVPNTGDVLACASYPSFDPSKPFEKTKKGEFAPGHAAAYMSSLEPGSTFKIVTLAKALDMGVVGAYENFNCPGSRTVGGKTIHCDTHGKAGGHGTIDPEQAISRSCNVVSAQWALRVGHDKFLNYIEELGLLGGSKLGLPGEATGLLDRNDPAQRLQLANLGFGQSLNVTPIALASAFCTIGNGGMAIQPRLVDRIGDEKQPVKEGHRLLKEETTQNVLQFMRSVIDSDQGTGRTLRISGYDLGGKTGTAQKMRTGGYVANFVGFVPAINPKAVILVMIDNPKGKQHYGAQVAGPVFLEVCKSVIKRMGIPHTSQLASRPAKVRAAQNVPVVKPTRVAAAKKAEPITVEEVEATAPSGEEQIASTGPEIEVSAREIPERSKAVIGTFTVEKIKKLVKTDAHRIADVDSETTSTLDSRDVKRRKEPEPKPKADSKTEARASDTKRKEESPKEGRAKDEAKKTDLKKSTASTRKRVETTTSKVRVAARTNLSNGPSSKTTEPVRKVTRKSTAVAVVSTGSSSAIEIKRGSEPKAKSATSSKPRPKTIAKPKASDRLKELEAENARLKKLLETRSSTRSEPRKATKTAATPTVKKASVATKKPISVTSKKPATAKETTKKVVAKKSDSSRKSSTSKPSSKKRT
ncbi:MAG: penicillin-binding transpeptidase domain-containing protein [Fimbriimonadaceae bacterium]